MDILKKIFVAAAVTCGAAWLLKMVAIATTGGAETEAAVVGVLWATGMLTYLLAAATGTALMLGRAPVWVRWLAGVIAAPVAMVALNALDTAAKLVYQADGWFRDELALVLTGVAMAALGLRMLRGVRRPQRL